MRGIRFTIHATLVGTVIVASIAESAVAQYFYGRKGQIPLKVDSTLVEVRFQPGREDIQLEILSSRIQNEVTDISTHRGSKVFQIANSRGYYKFLDSLRAIDGVERAEPFYRLASGTSAAVGGEISIKFAASAGKDRIAKLLESYSLQVVSTDAIAGEIALLRATKASPARLLDIANQLHREPHVEFAHPNFMAPVEKLSYTVYDAYHSYQPHLKKIVGSFNSASVWDFAGLTRPVKVAVIDDGLIDHEDLPAERILPGRDFSRDPVSCPTYGNDPANVWPGKRTAHGMACAGILAASHDSGPGQLQSSVFSLNPHAIIIPVKIFSDCAPSQTTFSDIADAIHFADISGAEVISCSWRFTDTSFDIHEVFSRLADAHSFGRHQKGTLIAFGTGNEGPGIVYYPARYEISFAVGASTLADSLAVYSSYEPYECHVDAVAPSIRDLDHRDLWSIDQMDTMGVNRVRGIEIIASADDFDTLHDLNNCPPNSDDLDYLCTFGGTSAATPMVAAIASLLISRDSTLRATKLPKHGIEEIIKFSAIRQLEGRTIDTADVKFGYGRVDAFRAVLSIARGDADNDGMVDIGDISALIDYLYVTMIPPFPAEKLGDCDCDGIVDLADISRLINYLYIHWDTPPVIPCYIY